MRKTLSTVSAAARGVALVFLVIGFISGAWVAESMNARTDPRCQLSGGTTSGLSFWKYLIDGEKTR